MTRPVGNLLFYVLYRKVFVEIQGNDFTISMFNNLILKTSLLLNLILQRRWMDIEKSEGKEQGIILKKY